MIQKFTKPIIVSAIQWKGDNLDEITSYFSQDEFWLGVSNRLNVSTRNLRVSVGGWLILEDESGEMRVESDMNEYTNVISDSHLTNNYSREILIDALAKAAQPQFVGEQWFDFAKSTLDNLGSRIDDTETPSYLSKSWSNIFLFALWQLDLIPYRIFNDVEGGVVFSFHIEGKDIDIVISNSEKIFYTSNVDGRYRESLIGELTCDTIKIAVNIVKTFVSNL